MPNLSTFKARFEQGGADVACSLAISNHLQHLELYLADLESEDDTPNGVFLRSNPRLLVASSEPLTDLHIKLKEIGVGYELAHEKLIDCLFWGDEFVPVSDSDHVLTEIYDI